MLLATFCCYCLRWPKEGNATAAFAVEWTLGRNATDNARNLDGLLGLLEWVLGWMKLRTWLGGILTLLLQLDKSPEERELVCSDNCELNWSSFMHE